MLNMVVQTVMNAVVVGAVVFCILQIWSIKKALNEYGDMLMGIRKRIDNADTGIEALRYMYMKLEDKMLDWEGYDKSGYWIEYDDHIECSECGYRLWGNAPFDYTKNRHCSDCGSKMLGVQKHVDEC